MNTKNRTTPMRALIAALLAGGALIGATNASAQQAAPFALRADMNSADYGNAHLMPVGLQLSIGWHNDRYWDGHRYWAHDEWMHRHPPDPGPPPYRDHRPPPRY